MDLTQRDRLRRAAGAAWGTIPSSGKQLARALQVNPSAITHRKQGERPTALARLCEEAYQLERAGISAAYLTATVHAIAMWPELERLSTEELESALRAALIEETHANSRANDLDARVLAGLEVDMEELRAAHLEQAARSERTVAILDILSERKR